MEIIPPPFMSKANWVALGTMEPRDRDERPKVFSQEEFDPYTGGRKDESGEDPDRSPPPERPYHPHVDVSSPNHPLGNPYSGSARNDYQRAQSLYQHYRRILSEGGDRARQLINALASTADRLLAEGGDSGFTVVAPTEGEARIIRGMLDWVLTVVPPSQGLKAQRLLTRNDQLPPVEDMLKALEAVRPEPWGRNLQADRGQGRVFVRSLAAIPARGSEEALAAVVARLPPDILVLVPDNRAFQKALRAAMGDAAYEARVWTRAKEEALKTGIDVPDLQGLTGRDFARAYRETIETLIDNVDGVLVGHSDDPRDAAVQAGGEAARKGTLRAVVTSEGTIIRGPDLDRWAEHAMQASPSRAEYARSRTVRLHDVPAGSPEGLLALSLLRQDGDRNLPKSAIEALARTGMTINELADMAKDRTLASELIHKHDVPLGAVAALRNDRAMANAREAFATILEDCRQHNVQILGPEHFPPDLRDRKDAPVVLFAQGNLSLLTSGRPLIGIVGDRGPLPDVAERARDFIRGVQAEGGVPMVVEHMGVPHIEGEQILVIPTGHGHYGKLPSLKWKEVGQPPHRGDVLVAETASHRYTIEIVERPEQKILYTVTKLDAVGDGASRTVEMPLRGERPRPYYRYDEEDVRGQKEGAKWTGDVRRAQEAAQANEAFIRSGDVRAHRQAVLDAGGVVVSLLPPRRERMRFSHATQALEGTPTDRQPANELKAVEIVVNSSKAVVATQVRQDSPVLSIAIDNSAERNRKVAVMPPSGPHPQSETDGNRALLSILASELPSVVPLRGNRALRVTQTFRNGKAAVSTGHDMLKAGAEVVKQARAIDHRLARVQAKRRAGAEELR